MKISDKDLMAYATHLALEAGQVAMRYFRGELRIEIKPDQSPVTEADKAIETFIRQKLVLDFPDDGLFGEEEGASGLGKDRVWVLDPIDGTRSFLSGYPTFGFLLAVLEQGAPKLGVIGMPALDEVYAAIDGYATCNGVPICVSEQRALDRAILYINEAEPMQAGDPEAFARLLTCGATRRFAHDCYPHALLAAGHIDAVVDYNLQPYDFLPLCPIIEAAGGIISDWSGQPLTLKSDGRIICAATLELHTALLETLS